MNNKRLEEILKKKKIRQQKQLIRLGIILVGLIALIFLIVSAINSIVSAIQRAIPTPTPTPVAVVSEFGELESTVSSDGEITLIESTKTTYNSLPDPKEQADIIECFESSNSDKKVCYLTFDDGPNKTITTQILDILRRYNIKATFFQVGSLIEENPDVSMRIHEEGHLLGNHSYDHTYEKMYASKNSFMEEFEACAKLIQEITKDDYVPIMRLPGGSYNTGTYGEIKQEIIKTLSEKGIYHCNWNALSGDAEGSYKSKAQLVERVKSTSKGKNQVVVLMHDASNKKQTVLALPEIIEYFISEGYTFSRLDKPLF